MVVTGQTVPWMPSAEEEDNERWMEAPSLDPPAVEGAANGLAIVVDNVTLNNLLV